MTVVVVTVVVIGVNTGDGADCNDVGIGIVDTSNVAVVKGIGDDNKSLNWLRD